MSQTGGEPTPNLAPIRPISRRSQRQITFAIAGLLLLLIGIRVLSTHPLPAPSHATAEGAVAGYLGGIEHLDAARIEAYLSPSLRGRTQEMVTSLRRERVALEAPTISAALLNGSRATVSVSANVCYQPGKRQSYTCQSLGHAPLGLPAEIVCRELGGKWYATTLFKPT